MLSTLVLERVLEQDVKMFYIKDNVIMYNNESINLFEFAAKCKDFCKTYNFYLRSGSLFLTEKYIKAFCTADFIDLSTNHLYTEYFKNYDDTEEDAIFACTYDVIHYLDDQKDAS